MIRDPQVRKAVLRELLLGAHLIVMGGAAGASAVLLPDPFAIPGIVGSVLVSLFSFHYWQERLRLVEGVDYVTPVSSKLAHESFQKNPREVK